MIARLLGGVIRLYQILLSPLLGNVCRFYPSCSEYAVVCLRRFGAVRGSLLAVGRICRCHPFHPGGVDLPPAHPGAPAERSSSGVATESGEP
ncbi:MAG: membrane protein insertion efficiency factor YidD [Deltaproteobacteria bacterium]|nr:membrane protein insertion efficiency factor YidD [Deltaproteobacteria bacterium]